MPTLNFPLQDNPVPSDRLIGFRDAVADGERTFTIGQINDLLGEVILIPMSNVVGLVTTLANKSDVLSSPVTANVAVGNISAAQVIPTGTTLEEFIESLLIKTYYPTFTSPSLAASSSIGTSVEAGTTGLTITCTYNRGSIVGVTVNGIWQSSTQQDYRAGSAIKYTIIGEDNGTDNALTSASAVVFDGVNTYTTSVSYNEGPQPVDSTGADYSSPLSSGYTSYNLTVYGRRKAFYDADTTASAPTISSQIRALGNYTLNPSDGTTFSISIAAGTTRVIFAYPASLGAVNSVKYVELGNAEVKDTFTSTTINVEGANSFESISYNVYYYLPSVAFGDSATYNITI